MDPVDELIRLFSSLPEFTVEDFDREKMLQYILLRDARHLREECTPVPLPKMTRFELDLELDALCAATRGKMYIPDITRDSLLDQFNTYRMTDEEMVAEHEGIKAFLISIERHSVAQ